MATRIVCAFVYVNATMLRVAFEASFAHTSRWITRRASRIYAAWETVTGVYNNRNMLDNVGTVRTTR